MKEGRYQYVSILVMCYTSGIARYDKRTPELAVAV